MVQVLVSIDEKINKVRDGNVTVQTTTHIEVYI